jgi:hypothetical protein
METDWPVAIVLGVVIPLTPNPVPLTETTEIARSALPLFEIKRVAFPVDPLLTVPNCTEVLLTAICGADATAVAERFTTAGPAPSLPWTVSVPVRVPALEGVTPTVKFPDWPVPIDIGRVTPVKLNCGLESVACVIETGMVPVFATAIVWAACFPTPTFPKFNAVGFT